MGHGAAVGPRLIPERIQLSGQGPAQVLPVTGNLDVRVAGVSGGRRFASAAGGGWDGPGDGSYARLERWRCRRCVRNVPHE